MKQAILGIFILALPGILIVGCGSDIESKNMEQIYAEEGVPVRVATVKARGFSSEFEYKAPLSGVLESSAYAMVADKIDRVNYRVGDYVKKDAVVLSFPTDNPAAQYFQAKVAFENAEATFERMKGYYETGGLSRQNFENAEAAYEVASANWDAVRQSVMVKAPISGLLTRVNVRESENVQRDDELFAVAQVDRLKARIWVSEKQICQFRKGQAATAHWNDITLEGEVVQVDMSVNQDHQAFGVVIEFANPDLALRCGVTATIRVAAYEDDEAIVVERKNLVKKGGQTMVFLAHDDVAVQQPVTLGRSSGLEVEIISGLVAGDRLITQGQMHLEDGKKIKVIEPEMRASSD